MKDDDDEDEVVNKTKNEKDYSEIMVDVIE